MDDNKSMYRASDEILTRGLRLVRMYLSKLRLNDAELAKELSPGSTVDKEREIQYLMALNVLGVMFCPELYPDPKPGHLDMWDPNYEEEFYGPRH